MRDPDTDLKVKRAAWWEKNVVHPAWREQKRVPPFTIDDGEGIGRPECQEPKGQFEYEIAIARKPVLHHESIPILYSRRQTLAEKVRSFFRQLAKFFNGKHSDEPGSRDFPTW